MNSSPLLTKKQLTVGSPFFGSLKYFKADRLNFLQQLSRLGPITETKLGPHRLFLVNHPDAIKHILVTQSKNYVKSAFYKPLEIIAGKGMVTAEGQHWLRQRRIAQSSFDQKAIVKYAESIGSLTDKWIGGIKNKSSIAISEEFMTLALGIISTILFSSKSQEAEKVLAECLPELLKFAERYNAQVVHLPLYIPTAQNRKVVRMLKQIDLVAQDILDAHKKAPHQDLLNDLMNASSDPNEAFSDQELKDQIMTLLTAGHETTALVLTYSIYFLGLNPSWISTIRNEVNQVLGKRTIVEFGDYQKMIQTQNVISESIRLLGPIWGFSRTCVSDDEILGVKIPSKSLCLISPYVLNRDDNYWKEPMVFNPDRFKETPNPFVYVPFGAGPRACIGKTLSLFESVCILARFIQSFNFSLNSFPALAVEPTITLRPVNPIWIKLEAL